jgi:hypothetical protein
MIKLIRWLAGSLAAFGIVFAVASADRAHAAVANPGAAVAIKDMVGEPAIQVRFGHRHGGFHSFHGFRHRAFFRPRVFHRARFYAYAPRYRCPLVWTVYGPRRICAFRRHYVRYWRHHHVHRYHYVHRYRHHRWM